MSETTSLQAYFAWQRSTERFDYFMAGLAGAISAYLGKDLRISTLGWNGSTVELVALLCFVGSTACALKRIEFFNVALRAGSRRAHHDEGAGAMLAASGRGGLVLNEETGDTYSPGDLIAGSSRQKKLATRESELEDRAGHRAGRFYAWRNRLLYLGFVMLALSRVLPALQG